MGKQNAALQAFNRGIVSPAALARVDVERVRLSAEQMNNFLPKTQGGMFLRPGLEYKGATRSNLTANFIPFIASTTDNALLEITDGKMRVWIDDVLLTRPSVTTTISNSSFATSANWTDASTGTTPTDPDLAGVHLTFDGSGLTMNAINRGGEAIVTRTITVSGGNIGVEHALEIRVSRGPVTFKVGSGAGKDDYIAETSLGTGYHNLAFTPTGDFYMQISTDEQVNRIVASLAIAAAGVVSITAPWAEANLDKLRWDQSADVLFVAAEGYRQQRIERRGTGRSWSIIDYVTNDGPFQAVRNAHVRLKPGATHGNTTLTSDKPFFETSHVGALFNLFHSGYHGRFWLAREDTYTDPIRVTGTNTLGGDFGANGNNDRDFSFHVKNTDGTDTNSGGHATGWHSTLTVQRSFDDPDTGYHDFHASNTFFGSGNTDIVENGSYENSDDDDNAIIWYRIGFKPGNYVSGAAQITVDYDGGGGFGICRVTGYTSKTEVNIEILKQFNDTVYTEDWREGLWSDKQGWPTAVAFFEGRLWWGGNIYIAGSVSDAYDSFSTEIDGDSGPIIRSIGSGPVDVVNWLLPLQRLLFATAGSEISCKSSSFDEPLTPQAFGARDCSTQGSATIAATKVDKRGVFIQRSKKRLFELVYDSQVLDYESKELTILCPDITGTASLAGIAVQRQPDTRLHLWLTDGTVLILTYEPSEDVLCFSTFSTGGTVERVAVLPGADEDKVYYVVNRTINGSTVRYLERWAKESDCKGSSRNKQLDSFTTNVTTVNGATTVVSGLTHLIGETVSYWAGGACPDDGSGNVATYTVNGSGQITVPLNTATLWVVGKTYTGRYKSSKLAYAAQLGTALTQVKRAATLGVILGTCHHKGLKAGLNFSNLDNLPAYKDGAPVATDTVFTEYDQVMHNIPGRWGSDPRLCLEANAPRVCEVLAAVIDVQTNDRG